MAPTTQKQTPNAATTNQPAKTASISTRMKDAERALDKIVTPELTELTNIMGEVHRQGGLVKDLFYRGNAKTLHPTTGEVLDKLYTDDEKNPMTRRDYFAQRDLASKFPTENLAEDGPGTKLLNAKQEFISKCAKGQNVAAARDEFKAKIAEIYKEVASFRQTHLISPASHHASVTPSGTAVNSSLEASISSLRTDIENLGTGADENREKFRQDILVLCNKLLAEDLKTSAGRARADELIKKKDVIYKFLKQEGQLGEDDFQRDLGELNAKIGLFGKYTNLQQKDATAAKKIAEANVKTLRAVGEGNALDAALVTDENGNVTYRDVASDAKTYLGQQVVNGFVAKAGDTTSGSQLGQAKKTTSHIEERAEQVAMNTMVLPTGKGYSQAPAQPLTAEEYLKLQSILARGSSMERRTVQNNVKTAEYYGQLPYANRLGEAQVLEKLGRSYSNLDKRGGLGNLMNGLITGTIFKVAEAGINRIGNWGVRAVSPRPEQAPQPLPQYTMEELELMRRYLATPIQAPIGPATPAQPIPSGGVQ